MVGVRRVMVGRVAVGAWGARKDDLKALSEMSFSKSVLALVVAFSRKNGLPPGQNGTPFRFLSVAYFSRESFDITRVAVRRVEVGRVVVGAWGARKDD